MRCCPSTAAVSFPEYALLLRLSFQESFMDLNPGNSVSLPLLVCLLSITGLSSIVFCYNLGNIDGGFCGSFSIQHTALAFGAWISQDLVRKANRASPGPHNMHGDGVLGYEVVPSNVATTAKHLRLAFDEWDYEQPKPQAEAFKRWVKHHLVRAHPLVWFPMCKEKTGGARCHPHLSITTQTRPIVPAVHHLPLQLPPPTSRLASLMASSPRSTD